MSSVTSWWNGFRFGDRYSKSDRGLFHFLTSEFLFDNTVRVSPTGPGLFCKATLVYNRVLASGLPKVCNSSR
jgi:hypothetical protein